MHSTFTLRQRAVLSLALTGILWSSSGIFIKLINWQPLSILGGRSLVAMIVFLVYLRGFPRRWTWPEVFGAVAFVATQLTFIIATKLTTSANVIFLQYTAPIYILLFGWWLLGERPHKMDWIAMLVIFSGMFLFFGDQLSPSGLVGNLIAALSGVCMAAMMLSLRSQKDASPIHTLLLGSVLGGLVGLPSMVREYQAGFTLPDLGIILFLGVLQIGLPNLLYGWAIRHVQALESTLILTLEPVLNPVWVFIFLKETPGPLAVLGGALVLGAITLRAVVSARQPET